MIFDILTNLIIITPVFYIIRTLRNLFYNLFWWEKKEYRLDRMYVHLTETYQGYRWLVNPISIFKWFILLLYFFGKISGDYFINFGSIFLVITIYLVEGIRNIYELRSGWKIPPFKPRIILIGLSSVVLLIGTIIFLYQYFSIFSLLIADKMLGLIITLFIITSNIFFNFYKNIKIKKAKDKISKAKNLKVIGITGSYGKTTTKELIAQVLSKKYRVLKTLGSQNTDIGIAERILSSDLSKYDYFVCEMAAYKIGEINDICKMLIGKIEIGVITGINEQHQSLFGSLENTKKAKFELINNVIKGGMAVFNGNSKHIEDMVKWGKVKGLRVIIVKKLDSLKLPASITGSHFAENLAITIEVAQILNISNSEIKKQVTALKLPEKTMNTINIGNLVLIDDTFNANPDGVYAAIEYLKSFDGKKILVLQPLIELGKYADKIHQKIGELAASICDEVVLTNRNFYKSIISGAAKVEGAKKIKLIESPEHISKGIVLFEGKEAEKYLNKYI